MEVYRPYYNFFGDFLGYESRRGWKAKAPLKIDIWLPTDSQKALNALSVSNG